MLCFALPTIFPPLSLLFETHLILLLYIVCLRFGDIITMICITIIITTIVIITIIIITIIKALISRIYLNKKKKSKVELETEDAGQNKYISADKNDVKEND
jgi:membrane protein implicated in regulation of membrane protease activity